ncbi:hypothetical protein KJ836_02455 [Patescibacteria group bacterium]|nr:hypothetical protein [Patescibacteria group bacterium]
MKFLIDPKIIEKFPGLILGIVVAKDINNIDVDETVITKLRDQEIEIKANLNLNTLSDIPKIASWQRAYSSFGAKPKKYRSSIENLLRMILEGGEIRHINKLVDIYNYVSIANAVPVGGDDLDKIDGDITLKFAQGDERFSELNSGEITHPHLGEVIYVDYTDVLCRRWNWRECDKSKMTEATKNAILVIEGLPPVGREDVQKAVAMLGTMIQESCGGKTETFILDTAHLTVMIVD